MRDAVVCNYAVVRFTPYTETQEFVNVGVILSCAKTGYMDLLVTTQLSRIQAFFPELDKRTIKTSLLTFREQFSKLQKRLSLVPPSETGDRAIQNQSVMPCVSEAIRAQFLELTKLRESLLTCSEVSTVLAVSPREKLKTLFAHYAERQFAQKPEYQERLLTSQVRVLLRTHNLTRLYQRSDVGNESYRVHLAFVSKDLRTTDQGTGPARAIQPLDLGKQDSSKIYEHGDHWLSRIQRLKKMDQLPQLLFTVGMPGHESALSPVALEVCDALKSAEAHVLPVNDEAGILHFARPPVLAA